MSNDVRMLLPVLVAIMVAKWVADAATHSLYHGQLHVKVCVASCEMCWIAQTHRSAHKRDCRAGCLISFVVCRLQAIPYLPEDPIASISLDLLPVSRVMKSPVVTFQVRLSCRPVLRSDTVPFVSILAPHHVKWLCPQHGCGTWRVQEKMQIKDLRWALRNTTHNGFPVVRSTQHGEVRSLHCHIPANGRSGSPVGSILATLAHDCTHHAIAFANHPQVRSRCL
jgi:hypothetical protein